MPTTFDIVRILSIGTVGLGFLLAYLAFRLLSKEQAVANPRANILKAINYFMVFSFGLCGIGLSSELYRMYHTPLANLAGWVQVGARFPMQQGEQTPVVGAAEAFLVKVDSKRFKDLYDDALTSTKKVISYPDFEAQCNTADKIFGTMKSRRFDLAFKGIEYVPDTGFSTVYYINFRSSYEKATNVGEMVKLVKTDDGAFKTLGHDRRQ